MFTSFKNKLVQNTIYSITINRYTTSPLLQFFEQGQALPKWDRESKPVYGNSLLYCIYTNYSIGRSWKASELKLKNFDDLHKLWFVLLKERNVLATQKAEAKRQDVIWMSEHRDMKCRESMERIRHVLIYRVKLYRQAMNKILLNTLSPEQAQMEELRSIIQERYILSRLKSKRSFRKWKRSHVKHHPLF